MKRAILAVFLLVPFLSLTPTAYAQTATVTGHVVNPSGAATGTGQVCFTLLGYKPQAPRVTLVGTIIQQTNFCVTASTADGSFSTSLYQNSAITPNGTFWRVDFLWNNVQQSSGTYLVNTNPFNLDTAQPIVVNPPVNNQIIGASKIDFNQATPSTTWVIPHNLGTLHPLAICYDTTPDQIFPDKVHVNNANTMTITFTSPQAGSCTVMNAGYLNIAQGLQNAVVTNPLSDQTISGPAAFNLQGPFNTFGTDTFSGPVNISGPLSVTGVATFTQPIIGSLAGNVNSVFTVDCANTHGWAGSDFGAWINSAIAALPTFSGFPTGVISLAPCSTVVTQSTGVVVTSPYVSVVGPGSGALQISCTVATDCWNIRTNPFSIVLAGTFGGFTLIGQGSSNANAVGIHTGDMSGSGFNDIQVDNFLGANSSCFWMDNQLGWFERNYITRLETGIHNGIQSGCTKGIRATVNGGTNSFSRTRFVGSAMSVSAGNVGLSVENGVFWYEGTIELGGNMVGNGGTVLSMSGNANLFNDRVDIGLECSNTCSSATLLNASGTSTMSWISGRLAGGAGFTNSITTSQHIRFNYGSYDQSTGDSLNTNSLSLYNNEGANFGVSILPTLGTPSFIGGFFDNLVFNGTNFVSATDLTNNGGAYVAGGHNGQLYFGIVPTASPSTGQTITQTNITTFKQATLTNSFFTLKPALDLTERAAPVCASGEDIVWGDSTYHGLKTCTNGSNIHKIALTESGSCSMSAGTTCTFSAGSAFNSNPLTFASIDAASTVPATANSAKCSISGTTVTITAGISNSLTWDCLLVGNPN